MSLAESISLARDLFDRIVNGDSLAILRAMVEGEPRAVESEWLEFKAFPWNDFLDPMKGYDPKNLKEKKKDFIKETWSQVLSAFANTQGGVLIWGIHAAKRDGVDEAFSFQLVPNPKALATRLMELQCASGGPRPPSQLAEGPRPLW
ncbi:ATP-binding protein [Singulisphaera sp. Ch08]|uniref:ATP-binding protein n=1 Tax=Singulisphaera sp. Ch08 TaxID=3120278 RepID=A0AAU7CMU6_9BACT